MPQKQPSPIVRCDRCQKPLQHTLCTQCNGKGFVRKLLLFSQECEVCQGQGWYLACPDALKHILDEFKVARPSISRSLSQPGPKTSQAPHFTPARKQSIRPKQQPVPPPWAQPNNPMNPNSILNPNNPMNPNSWRNPNNPMNPNSILNPNNPLNPNSILNPNNPMNPHSLRNPNNPLNPNSLQNPNNPLNRFHKNTFKK